MKTDALIAAGGKGQRMGGRMKKQFISLKGMPLLFYTLKAFEEFEGIEQVCLVLDEGDFEYCRGEIIQKYGITKVSQLVRGGERRQDSVWNGLKAMEGHCDTVIIHDGVRPFVSPDMLKRLMAAMEDVQAVVTAIPAQDTIKRVDGGGNVVDTLQRNTLFHIQTPQGFRYSVIKDAYQKALKEGIEGTDDASFVERMGIRVKVIEGSPFNIKITTPEDIALAHYILKEGKFAWRESL
ncbi:MAG: 2-C-methyl-D-erythritol 4-phosphate cytidylyltransferase [Syntrophobacterales bacterium]|nr:MAG: 2-C-methyl-D-erythritol 4-phosphate cytidylyltransferase [Syntrophobacterales bacterium]